MCGMFATQRTFIRRWISTRHPTSDVDSTSILLEATWSLVTRLVFPADKTID
jgi:hypothetical protein